MMAAERHLYLFPDAGPALAYDALLDLLADDGEALGRFARACRRFVIVPDSEVMALRSALSRRGRSHTYADVEAALYELALEELPGSWAAGRERLRRRVRGRNDEDGARTAATAIEDLVAGETVWLRELALLAEDTPDYSRLREVSARVWAALRRRRQDFGPEHFSEYVHEVMCAVFPYARGAAWDYKWAGDLARRALVYVAERAPACPDTSASDEVARAYEEVVAAAEVEDRRRYRRALREWVAATRTGDV